MFNHLHRDEEEEGKKEWRGGVEKARVSGGKSEIARHLPSFLSLEPKLISSFLFLCFQFAPYGLAFVFHRARLLSGLNPSTVAAVRDAGKERILSATSSASTVVLPPLPPTSPSLSSISTDSSGTIPFMIPDLHRRPTSPVETFASSFRERETEQRRSSNEWVFNNSSPEGDGSGGERVETSRSGRFVSSREERRGDHDERVEERGQSREAESAEDEVRRHVEEKIRALVSNYMFPLVSYVPFDLTSFFILPSPATRSQPDRSNLPLQTRPSTSSLQLQLQLQLVQSIEPPHPFLLEPPKESVHRFVQLELVSDSLSSRASHRSTPPPSLSNGLSTKLPLLLQPFPLLQRRLYRLFALILLPRILLLPNFLPPSSSQVELYLFRHSASLVSSVRSRKRTQSSSTIHSFLIILSQHPRTWTQHS